MMMFYTTAICIQQEVRLLHQSRMFLQILESVCSQGFVYLQMLFLMVGKFYFLLFVCPRHCLHIILIGVGTEMTEIGDGIYTMSPTPMEVGESLIDHQSPYKSSRLDNLLKQSKANYLNALEAEYLRKADCNYSLPFLIIVPSSSKLFLIVTVMESFPQLML